MLGEPRQPRRLVGQAEGLRAPGVSRISEPRWTPMSPSWATMSFTTRSFAVAVVPSTGMLAGMAWRTFDQPPVVGAEVVPQSEMQCASSTTTRPMPVRDRQQDVAHEFVVGQAFRRDQHRVRLIGEDAAGEAVPVVRLVESMVERPDAQPLRRHDLVAHQRQQGGDDQRRPGPPVAQDAGGDEVDRALPPAGALDHQQLPPVVHQRVDRFPLAVPEVGVPGLAGPGGAGPGRCEGQSFASFAGVIEASTEIAEVLQDLLLLQPSRGESCREVPTDR